MRLIDADALKAVIMETTCNPGTIGEVVAMIFCGIIDEQPEAVVRCKNCVHDNDCAIQDIAQTGFNFFCGCAERRVDETDRC